MRIYRRLRIWALRQGPAFTTVDRKVSAMTALHAREWVAMGVWFKHHNELRCRRIPLADRILRPQDTAGGGASVQSLGMDLLHRCGTKTHGVWGQVVAGHNMF